MTRRLPRPGRMFAAMTIAAAVVASACSPPSASNLPAPPATVPPLPSKPVQLTVLDIAGDLSVSQPLFDNYVRTHPNVISKINYLKAPPTDVNGKIQAQQNAGQVTIDMVLTGSDGLSSMEKQNQAIKLLPNYGSEFGDLQAQMDPGAWQMEQASDGYGILTSYGPSGPLLQYEPSRVPNPPTSPQALLDWAKAHPGRFVYARPDESGPSRIFLMGLPYLLGDSNPQDPVHGWTKTWAYLRELNKYVQYYPSSTTEALKQLADGSRDITPDEVGIDIGDRANGTLPADSQVGVFDGMHWISDGHYVVIPKGVPPDQIAAVLDLTKWLLRPDQQALTYGKGYITFPVKGVGLNLAPPDAQAYVQKWGRLDFYQPQLAAHPVSLSLSSDALSTAFDMWNRQIGSLGAGK